MVQILRNRRRMSSRPSLKSSLGDICSSVGYIVVECVQYRAVCLQKGPDFIGISQPKATCRDVPIESSTRVFSKPAAEHNTGLVLSFHQHIAWNGHRSWSPSVVVNQSFRWSPNQNAFDVVTPLEPGRWSHQLLAQIRQNCWRRDYCISRDVNCLIVFDVPKCKLLCWRMVDKEDVFNGVAIQQSTRAYCYSHTRWMYAWVPSWLPTLSKVASGTWLPNCYAFIQHD